MYDPPSMDSLTFPDGFVWGTASAAHQVEGGNWASDWWEWEHRPGTPCVEPSGDTCDHLNRYAEDIALLARLGFNCYRFSIEWSRIEPEQGEWSNAALDHYRRVLAACHAHGLTPIVTFHHFTTPRWAAAAGGWQVPETAEHFARFCERSGAALGDLVGWACTLNEPNIVTHLAYVAGQHPPGLREPHLVPAVTDTFLAAHRLGSEALKAGPGSFPVGMTMSMQEYWTVPGDAEAEAWRAELEHELEDVWLDALTGDDFVGVQAYSRARMGGRSYLGPEEGAERTLMGYEWRPSTIGVAVRKAASRTGCPVVVTENGVAVTDDARRVAFIDEALEAVGACLDEGIDVRGYVYWSTFDNFEWQLGYRPTFGLIEVDRTTFERRPKPSAAHLGAIARTNRLPAG